MSIKVYQAKVSSKELQDLAQETYRDMIKGVVDITLKKLAFGGELHADCEKILLDQGSLQVDLWGFNLYFDKAKEDRLEYTSFINIRPKQANFQIEIKDEQLRLKIKTIIDALVD